MWKISYFLLVLGAAVNLKYAYAVNDEEKANLIESMKPHITACAQEFGYDGSEVEELAQKRHSEPCFFQCILEQSGAFSDGMIDVDDAFTQLKTIIHDQDEANKLIEIGHECAEIANGSNLSDEDKDCERVNIFGICLMKNKEALLLGVD